MTVENVADPRPYSSVSGAWITGTPTTLGLYPFTVQATDSSSPPIAASRIYMMRVSPLSYDGIPNGEFAVPYSESFRILGGVPPYTVAQTKGTLPSGLAVDNDALVSGTPTESGNLWFQLRATA